MGITYGGVSLDSLGFTEYMAHEHPCAARNVTTQYVPGRLRGGYDIDDMSNGDVELTYSGSMAATSSASIDELLRTLKNAVVRGERLRLEHSGDPLWYRVARGKSVRAVRKTRDRCDVEVTFVCDAYMRLKDGDVAKAATISDGTASYTFSNPYAPCRPYVSGVSSGGALYISIGGVSKYIAPLASGDEWSLDCETMELVAGADSVIASFPYGSYAFSGDVTVTATNCTSMSVKTRMVSL